MILPAEQMLPLSRDGRDARVVGVLGPVDVAGFGLPVVGIDLLQVQDGQSLRGRRLQNDIVRALQPLKLLVGNGEGDRKGPRQARHQTHLLEDALVVRSAHEPCQGAERPDRETLQIGKRAGGNCYRGRSGLIRPLPAASSAARSWTSTPP